MKVKRHSWSLVFMLMLLPAACYNKDMVDLEEDVYYHPEFSVPIGESKIDMAYIVEDYWGDLYKISDTLNLPDSLILFYKDSVYSSGVTSFIYGSIETVDMSSFENKFEYITSAMIRTNAINRIPASIFTQLYFLNSSYQVIDSLYRDGGFEIEAAEVDSTGKLVQATEVWKKDIELSEEIIQLIPQIAYVQTLSRVQLEDYFISGIHYLEEQDIWIQLALRIKLDLPLHEL